MAMEWFDAVPITEVYNRLYVGGYVQAAKLRLNNPNNIQAVLDVSTEPPYEESKDIVYAHIPFDDGGAVPEPQFWACMKFLFEQYRQGKNCLVHCAAGISRSVSIASAFLYFAKIMDFEDALNYVRQRRQIANPHRDILNSIRKILHVWPHDGSMEK
jgi:atypical dual specificity phosphatase